MVKTPEYQAPPRGPLSRLLRVRDVPDAGLHRAIDATPAECLAVAEDFKLPAVASVHADLRVAPQAGDRFVVTGTVEAVVTQNCVVTLDPFETTLRQDVAVTFAQPAARAGAALDVSLDVLDDAPDLLVDNTIDLGRVVMEFLALACDPYPRKPGVHFRDVMIGEEEAEPSPFAALGRLKDRS